MSVLAIEINHQVKIGLISKIINIAIADKHELQTIAEPEFTLYKLPETLIAPSKTKIASACLIRS
jgi:hypothetical protein